MVRSEAQNSCKSSRKKELAKYVFLARFFLAKVESVRHFSSQTDGVPGSFGEVE